MYFWNDYFVTACFNYNFTYHNCKSLWVSLNLFDFMTGLDLRIPIPLFACHWITILFLLFSYASFFKTLRDMWMRGRVFYSCSHDCLAIRTNHSRNNHCLCLSIWVAVKCSLSIYVGLIRVYAIICIWEPHLKVRGANTTTDQQQIRKHTKAAYAYVIFFVSCIVATTANNVLPVLFVW